MRRAPSPAARRARWRRWLGRDPAPVAAPGRKPVHHQARQQTPAHLQDARRQRAALDRLDQLLGTFEGGLDLRAGHDAIRRQQSPGQCELRLRFVVAAAAGACQLDALARRGHGLGPFAKCQVRLCEQGQHLGKECALTCGDHERSRHPRAARRGRRRAALRSDTPSRGQSTPAPGDSLSGFSAISRLRRPCSRTDSVPPHM